MALTAATAASVFAAYGHTLSSVLLHTLDGAASILGVAGTLASAMIYLVQARPSWNLKHTPIDFIVTAGLLGALLTAAFNAAASFVTLPAPFHEVPSAMSPLVLPIVAASAALWIANQGTRILGLRASPVFERRASFNLVASSRFRMHAWASLLLVAVAPLLLLTGLPIAATACEFLAFCSRATCFSSPLCRSTWP